MLSQRNLSVGAVCIAMQSACSYHARDLVGNVRTKFGLVDGHACSLAFGMSPYTDCTRNCAITAGHEALCLRTETNKVLWNVVVSSRGM